jgi:mannose-6-phosphate isomerase-like protein (cupin superfamily)
MANSINEVGKIYQRPWGTYQTLAQDDGFQAKIITVDVGGRLSLQKHFKRSEHWVVVAGKPTITVDASVKEYQPGQYIFIPLEAHHRLENFAETPAKIIEVQVGSYLGEDDIVRLDDVYQR